MRKERAVSFVPSMQRVMDGHELRSITLGHPLVDACLEFVGARGVVNTWLATAYDLKVFFEVVGKDPADVTSADVFAFLGQQRTPRQEKVVRIEDGEAGLSARTIARRLSSVAGLFDYLIVRDDAGVERNPVPRGLAGRRTRQRGRGGVRLVRRPRTLPKVLSPVEVDALLGALRTQRDRAIVLAMLLGGLRRCEALGVRCGMSIRASGGCSWGRGTAAGSGSCRSRVGSSRCSARTCGPSARRRCRPTPCSWCSRAHGAVCRCRPRGWMR
jgi:hypothetical protein